MTMDAAIRADGLGKRYRLGQRGGYKTLREAVMKVMAGPFRRATAPAPENHIWALKDVSFEVARGEVLGVIGRNGAGKSTLLKILSRISSPTEGRAEVYGRLASLLEVGTGFHPEMTGRENVYFSGSVLGMRREEIRRRFDEIVAFAGVEKFIDTPLKHYSSGMHLRLGFAVAAHLESDILFVDEVLAVGDAQFQTKCLDKMREVTHAGRTVLFVSHNMAAIQGLCRRALLLEGGRVVEDGDSKTVVARYLGGRSTDQPVLRGAELERCLQLWSPEPSPLVRCCEIALTDASGTPRSDFDSDEDVHVRITYDCFRPVAALEVIVALFSEESFLLLRTENWDVAGVAPAAHDPGRYAATCILPKNSFGDRTFRLTVIVMAPELQHHVFSEVMSLRVRFKGYNNNFSSHSANIYFRPQLPWRTERLGDPGRAPGAGGDPA